MNLLVKGLKGFNFNPKSLKFRFLFCLFVCFYNSVIELDR